MTIDLTKLKAGDTVKFDAGGALEVPAIRYHSGCVTLYDTDGNTIGVWSNGGSYTGSGARSPFDIVEIIPKKEPLKREVWLNLYVEIGRLIEVGYESRHDADRAAAPDRVGRMKVILEEGRFDE
jgi:hypothetical protein